jgi:tRNA(fMet)-specific endonuclease VapC
LSLSLDTNVCIDLLTASSVAVRRRYEQALVGGYPIYISSIVVCELWYGVSRSARPYANAAGIEELLAGGLDILPFTTADAKYAGRIREELERAKQPIGPYDTLIAGQALARGLTLVTANTREFARVPGLVWQDWSIE